MARDYNKTTIRLEKIHKRSLKKTYKGLTPLEKRVIKNAEAFEQVSKELDFFWRKTAVYNRVNGRYVAVTSHNNLEKPSQPILREMVSNS